MSTDPAAPAREQLQFDRYVPTSDAAAPGGAGVTCTGCRTVLTAVYWHAGESAVCAACRRELERHAAPVKEWRTIARAALFGLGASVAGAVVYYGVIAITDFEIGIVAILIGWMVGRAIQTATGGRGGRRLQFLGVALVYLSVSLAYLPLAMKGITEAEGERSAASVTDSLHVGAGQADGAGAAPGDAGVVASTASGAASRAAANASTNATAGAATDADDATMVPSALEETPSSLGQMALALVGLLLFSLALPLFAILGSLPGGLLSALIIGIGLHQAWSMARVPNPGISGPYRVGGATGSGSDAA